MLAAPSDSENDGPSPDEASRRVRTRPEPTGKEQTPVSNFSPERKNEETVPARLS